MINKLKLLTATAVLTLLSACGGGGGGVSGPVASTESFSVTKMWANMLTTPSINNITVQGTINSGDPVTGSGTTSYSNLSAGTFEGKPLQKQTQTSVVSLVSKGQTIPVNDKIDTWVDSNYTPNGESGGDDYVVVTALGTLPSAARINDTGNLFTANRYASSTKAVLNGTRTATYLIEADTASTALVSLIIEEKNTSNVTTSKSTLQLRITPTGAFTRIKETYVSTTTSLTITY